MMYFGTFHLWPTPIDVIVSQLTNNQLVQWYKTYHESKLTKITQTKLHKKSVQFFFEEFTEARYSSEN